jgi:hypothetical protein
MTKDRLTLTRLQVSHFFFFLESALFLNTEYVQLGAT